MIGDNCYAGDCASPELCTAVPVPPGSAQRSQIAYITAPGRKKAEDKSNNAGKRSSRSFNSICQKQPPELFYKKGVLKHLAKFAGKHLYRDLFFNKVAGLQPATLL